MDQVLFNMMCNGSLGYLSNNTSHYSFYHFNDDKTNYEEEVIEVYLGVESNGHMYLDTINYSSGNNGGNEISGHRYQETSHYISINHGCHGRTYLIRFPPVNFSFKTINCCLPANYYYYYFLMHSHMYTYSSLALTFYASQLIYTYRVFSRT